MHPTIVGHTKLGDCLPKKVSNKSIADFFCTTGKCTVSPANWVVSIRDDVLGVVEKISKHKNVKSKIVNVRESCEVKNSAHLFSGWTKKIKLSAAKPVFKEGNYIQSKHSKQWFKVEKVCDQNTTLRYVLINKQKQDKKAAVAKQTRRY